MPFPTRILLPFVFSRILSRNNVDKTIVIMLTNSTSLIGGIRWLHLPILFIYYRICIPFKLNRHKWDNVFFKQGQSKTVLDKYLFNSSFILYVSGWFRSHWKRMEVCCHGFRQGLPDSLYFFYCVTFGSCLDSSTSCNSWIRRDKYHWCYQQE